MGSADCGGRGAGANPGSYRIQHLDPRGRRRLGRRLRRQRADAGPGGHRHAGSCQFHGAVGLSLHRQVSHPDDAARRCLHHQRSLEGHRASSRFHRRDAGVPPRPARRALRLHQPCRRYRRPRHGPRCAPSLRGGDLHPADAFCHRRRRRSDADRDRARQCARAGPGDRRSLFARRLQRCRQPPAAADDGRVRDRQPRPARRPHPRALEIRDAGGRAHAAARDLSQPHARRRLRQADRPRRRHDHRRERHPCRFHRHLGALFLRHQRAVVLHRGLFRLRHQMHRGAEGAQQRGLAVGDDASRRRRTASSMRAIRCRWRRGTSPARCCRIS